MSPDFVILNLLKQYLFMEILNAEQINTKIKRLAIEILEEHYTDDKCFLAGINKNGLRFSTLLLEELNQIRPGTFHLLNIKLNPANPLQTPVMTDTDIAVLNGQKVILIDDVANTGRTLWYAAKPLMDVIPATLEVAVLIDRKHKSYPIHVNYVGLSLATTAMENIKVDLNENKMKVILE